MGAQIQEKEKSLATYLPVGVLIVSVFLVLFALWPRYKAYKKMRGRFLQEQATVEKIHTRWQSILQKERYYRKIYANLEEITKKVGHPQTDVDYMRFFVDRSRSEDFRILSFRKLGKKKEKNRESVSFSLSLEGRYSEIGGYLHFLENAYPLIFLDQIQIKRKRGKDDSKKLLQVQLKGRIIVLT